MVLDLAQLKSVQSGSAGAQVLEPRKIFSTLKKDSRFRRPTDDQGEILDKWFTRRASKDNTIKMNTGSGKTLAGLLILQSCLNEGVFPAVYTAADKYLVDQVLDEARDLGISVTSDENDPLFISGKAILVTNIYKIFNGKSVFGTGSTGRKISIGSIIIDDAHACLDVVANQFKIQITSTHPLHAKLLKVFEDDLKSQSIKNFLSIQDGDPEAYLEIPFWAWQKKHSSVVRQIHQHKDDDELKFSYPLISDSLLLSRCVISGSVLEITPKCIPVDEIPSFISAKRRIYMSATLADDGILIRNFGCDTFSVTDPIKPKGAGEIGDRMILAPQEINPSITIDEIKASVAKFSKKINVVVIVPSKRASAYWSDVANQILLSDNIYQGIDKLKSGHVGLTVLVNKYDGIDLPDDACRLLVIHDTPKAHDLMSRREATLLDGTEQYLTRVLQKIEQGMGRGVRSADDFCGVLLIGSALTSYLHRPGAKNIFSAATKIQLDLSANVAKQIKGSDMAAVEQALSYCLNRNSDWWELGRQNLALADDINVARVEQSTPQIRRAFDLAHSTDYQGAVDQIQLAVRNEQEPFALGYLKQELAEYTNFIDEAKAQEILLAARLHNKRLIAPIRGINFSKRVDVKSTAPVEAARYLSKFASGNDLTIHLNGIIEDLKFDPDTTGEFENAVELLGMVLGFTSERPERDMKAGPDNFWASPSGAHFVIECKSGATSGLISKSDCNQLLGSISWHEQSYSKNTCMTPVMLHPRKVFSADASPKDSMRIIDFEKLDALKTTLLKFSAELAGGDYKDSNFVEKRLLHYRLNSEQFILAYTRKAA